MLEVENSYFFSDEDLMLIKDHFAGNEALLKLMRKVFIPSYHDTASDIGGFTDDMHNNKEFDVASYASVEQAFIGMQARMKMIQLTESSLWRIKMLAGTKKESIAETKARLSKNSTK
jgi:hypothetical protein